MLRSKLTSIIVGLLAILVLASCKSGSKKNPATTPSLTLTAAVTAPVPPATVSSLATSQPGPTLTPYLLPPDALFQEAAGRARVALAAQLNLSVEQITVLDSDTVLLLPPLVQCPDIQQEGVTPYYVYVQFERSIYPFQFYTPPGGGDMVVEQCGDVFQDQDMLYVPTSEANTTVEDKVKADLQSRGIDPSSGTFLLQAVTWPDVGLGCPVAPEQPTPAPAFIDGYRVVYTLGGVQYEYHTDKTGQQLAFCAPPAGTDSVDAFIAKLQAVNNLDVSVITGEPATYQGLDAQGVRVELTSNSSRIGLFAFDTPEAARAAAQQIDDAGVSRIFVSGKVLIVQEENDPAVYNILLKYAEEVRAPIQERQIVTPEETPAAEPGG